MAYLPGQDGILTEAVEIAALTQSAFISSDNFATLPYLKRAFNQQADRILVEKLLSLAIKLRFLDEKTKVLKNHDRRVPLLGKYFENDQPCDEKLCIREALNKLIHHDDIFIHQKEMRFIVMEPTEPTLETGLKVPELEIPPGQYRSMIANITVSGKNKKTAWRFEINLFRLLDEVFRVFEQSKGL